MKEWYTVPEVAARFGVSKTLIRYYINRKKLRAEKIGRDLLIPASEVARIKVNPTFGLQLRDNADKPKDEDE